jgi:uncharacterized protein (TIGR02246 family)
VKSDSSVTHEKSQIRSLYQKLLDCWNKRSAADFAAVFAEDGNVVGFDGSQLHGRSEIESSLAQIFRDHQTAAFVGNIREVRILSPGVAILRAVAGMVPPAQSDINPAVNAIQTLVAAKQDERWHIVLFQNTPAAFHGRPEASQSLTEELRQALREASPDTMTGKSEK